MMNSIGKRLLAIILCAVLCVSLLPVRAVADGIIMAGGGVILSDEETAGTEDLPKEEKSADEPEVQPEKDALVNLAEQSQEVDREAAEEPTGERAEEKSAKESGTDDLSIIDSGTCGDNLSWTLDNEGTLTISGTGDMWDFEAYDNTPTYKRRPLLIERVILEDGITSIGRYSFFYLNALSSVTIPSSVANIGEGAFLCSGGLSDVEIPSSVIQIGGSAFGETALSEIAIPQSVISIGSNAFSGCKNLSRVDLPTSITSIESGVFSECSGLYTIDIPASVTNIGDSAFSESGLRSVVIPDSVTNIGDNAFSKCYSLASVDIGLRVTSIGEYAFRSCGLSSVTIPSSVTAIGEDAFYRCNGLSSVIIETDDAEFGYRVFESCQGLATAGPIGSGCNIEFVWTTEIPAYTFYGCDGLTSVTLPSQLKKIGVSAFCETGLTSVELPAGLTEFEEAFSYCSNLETAILPQGLTIIDDAAFNSCENLKNIAIPDSVTSIGQAAFIRCTSLAEITIPDKVTSIGDYAFSGCSALQSIEIPSNVKSIGQEAFESCGSLSNLVISEGVKSIGYQAFASCGQLNSVKIPDSVTAVGKSAFAYCGYLYDVELSKKMPSIESGLFMYDNSLQTVKIPVSVTTVESNAFYECNNLTTVYYSGTEEAWENVFINEGNEPLLNATIIFGGEEGPIPPPMPLYLSDVVFFYKSSITKNTESYYNMNMFYDESWFLQSSEAYNHDLARMSIRTAMAAFGVPGTAYEAGTTRKDSRTRVNYKKTESSTSTSENIVDLFEKLRFTRIELFYEAPGMDTIGYAIASKQFQDDNGETITLIAVAVRGGGYEQEWASNFTVGTAGEHQGFSDAASEVVNAVQDHIDRLLINDGVEKNIKIWMTGYSRAAATTNIAAKVLTDYARNHTIKGVNEDSIFAYCFECPRGVQLNSPSYSTAYNNIYSVVNYADVVPKVAPGDDIVTDIAGGDWNYGRYGVTYYLPAAELTREFSNAYEREVREYNSIIGNTSLEKWDEGEKYSTLMKGQGLFGDKVVSAFVSFFKNREVYCAGYQAIGRDIGAAIGGDYHVGTVLYAFVTGIPSFVTIHPVISAKVGLNFNEIGYAHYPELCLAWMDSIGGADGFCYDLRTRQLIVNCPVDIQVYDSSDLLVAQILGNEITEIEGSTIGAYIDENGQKIVILPVDEEYRIEVAATDAGTVTYTVEEVDVDAVSTERVVSYYEVDVEEGDKLTGIVEDLNTTDNAEYPLITEEGEKLTPDADLSASEAVQYTVTVSADEGGTVTGGGLFVTGEFAQITATPNEGVEFLGWYNGKELVSEEAEYRFLVTGDMTLMARFNSSQPEIVYTLSETELTLVAGKGRLLTLTDEEGNTVAPDWSSSDEEVAFVSSKGVITAKKAGKATITATVSDFSTDCEVIVQFTDVTDSTRSFYAPVYWALEHGITTGTSKTTFSPDKSCTRAQIVTFLWRLKGCPEPNSLESPFKDVTNPSSSFYKPVLWALENGITTGTSKTTFSPDKACTRAQSVTFLWRALGEPEPSTTKSPFKDVTNPGASYYKAVLWALENGITTGTSKTTFSPNNTCTRGQIVTFLYRYNNLSH